MSLINLKFRAKVRIFLLIFAINVARFARNLILNAIRGSNLLKDKSRLREDYFLLN